MEFGKYNSENTSLEIQIGRYKSEMYIMEIRIGEQKSKDTNRKNTNRTNTDRGIQIGRTQFKNTNQENTYRIQFGKCKSRKIQVVTVQIGKDESYKYRSENTIRETFKTEI